MANKILFKLRKNLLKADGKTSITAGKTAVGERNTQPTAAMPAGNLTREAGVSNAAEAASEVKAAEAAKRQSHRKLVQKVRYDIVPADGCDISTCLELAESRMEEVDTLERVIHFMIVYQLTPEEYFLLKLIILAQRGEYGEMLLSMFYSQGQYEHGVREVLKRLQEKQVICKSYVVPDEKTVFRPEDVKFNQRMLDRYYEE